MKPVTKQRSNTAAKINEMNCDCDCDYTYTCGSMMTLKAIQSQSCTNVMFIVVSVSSVCCTDVVLHSNYMSTNVLYSAYDAFLYFVHYKVPRMNPNVSIILYIEMT